MESQEYKKVDEENVGSAVSGVLMHSSRTHPYAT